MDKDEARELNAAIEFKIKSEAIFGFIVQHSSGTFLPETLCRGMTGALQAQTKLLQKFKGEEFVKLLFQNLEADTYEEKVLLLLEEIKSEQGLEVVAVSLSPVSLEQGMATFLETIYGTSQYQMKMKQIRKERELS